MNSNNLSFLDLLTILSFVVGVYALELAMQNLIENEEQSKTQQELLHKLNLHLHEQDGILSEQTEVYLKNINDKLDKVNGKEE